MFSSDNAGKRKPLVSVMYCTHSGQSSCGRPDCSKAALAPLLTMLILFSHLALWMRLCGREGSWTNLSSLAAAISSFAQSDLNIVFVFGCLEQ